MIALKAQHTAAEENTHTKRKPTKQNLQNKKQRK